MISQSGWRPIIKTINYYTYIAHKMIVFQKKNQENSNLTKLNISRSSFTPNWLLLKTKRKQQLLRKAFKLSSM